MRSVLVALATVVTMVSSSSAFALNCQQVRTLTGVYFKMHFYHHDFDDELSKRSLDTFIKAWDPGKVYFLKADVDSFVEKYGTKLDDMLLDANCKAIEDVVSLYSKRFQERQAMIDKAIEAKHDFTIDEYMVIDRKKLDYATTTEEIAERWRQRIKFQLLQLNDTMKDLAKAKEKLHKRYNLMTKRHNEMTSDEVYSIFLNAFASSLDPHSEYMAPEQLEDFRIQTRLSLEGIGAVLRSEDGFTTIQSLVPGGAAAKTGKVKVDDKIIAVAQGAEPPTDVIDMDLREVVKLIRGARATEVRLTLVREDSGKTTQLVVPIIREQVQLKDRAAKSLVYPVSIQESKDQPAHQYKIGVIELPSFYMDFEGRQNHEKDFKSSSEDMKNEIANLKKQNVDSIIVDLRTNGGGSLDESISIAGLFFDEGPVVQTKDPRGTIFVSKDEDKKTYYNGPLLVLINRQSASASEIFAGAIQDYGRGLIVGDTHTFGKGTVQNLNDIDEKLGAIKVTISKFYRPSGSSTQLRGVESDIVLPDLLDEYEIGEKHYDYALPWEKIKATEYKKFNQVQPYVKQLTDASKARVASDPGFAKIFEAVKEYKGSEKERSQVSLKEGKDKSTKLTDKVAKGKDKGKDVAKHDKDGKKSEDLIKKLEEEEEGEHPPIQEDFQLQETLKIAGDYLQLIGKHPLAKVTIPSLDVAVAAQAKKADEVKNKP